MRGFFDYFVKRPMLANIITIMIVLLGVYSGSKLNRDTFPNVDMGEMMIYTNFRGASSADTELLLTNKIEEELSGIDGIEQYISYSSEGYSSIQIKLDFDHPDQEGIKQDVRNAVDRVEGLPLAADTPVVLDIDASIFPVLELGLAVDPEYEDDITYTELRERAKSFKRKLLALNGVSKLDEFGYYDPAVKIHVYPELLEGFKLSLAQVAARIQSQNQRRSLGQVQPNGDIEQNIFVDARFDPPESAKDLVIRSNFNGKQVRLSDIATVETGYEDPQVISHIDGRSAISFYLYKSSNVDVLDLMRDIDALIVETEEFLPEGVSILKSHDFSKYLKVRFNVLITNGTIGLLAVVLLLALFLNLRLAFWVGIGIPVSVLGCVFLLGVFGQSLNLISMMALILVIGIIVDDGIIVGENILRRRESGDDPEEAATQGITEVFRPVLTTVLTTFLAFCPMFFMSGIMGRFIFVIPLVVSSALFVSLIEVTLALPVHLLATLKSLKVGHAPTWRDRMLTRLKGGYRRLLWPCLQHYYVSAAGLFVVIILVGIASGMFLSFTLFPEEAADQFFVQIELEEGTPVEESIKAVAPIEQIILALPEKELETFTTRAGQSGDNFGVLNQENNIVIHVDLKSSSTRDRTAREIVEDTLRPKTDALTGFKDIKYKLDSGGPPTGEPITLRLIGGSQERRNALADLVMETFQGIEGVKDLRRDDTRLANRYEIQLKENRMAQLGVDTSTLLDTLSMAYAGQELSSLRKNDEDWGIWLQLQDKSRRSLSTLMNLTVPNQNGQLIRLSQVATLKEVPGNPTYIHFNGERAITITGDVNKETTTVFTAMAALDEQINFAQDWSDVQRELGGEGEESVKSTIDLLKTFVIAMVGIFFLLMILFGSIVQPFLVLLAVPFGLIGVTVTHMVHNIPLGFLSMIGTIGLCGVVVNDSLVMVNHINELRKEKPDAPILDIVAEGAVNRFRPIILTTLTTVVGLLPLAHGIGGSDPFLEPIAYALGYGLFFSTPLILFFLPSYYMVTIKWHDWIHRNDDKKASKSGSWESY